MRDRRFIAEHRGGPLMGTIVYFAYLRVTGKDVEGENAAAVNRSKDPRESSLELDIPFQRAFDLSRRALESIPIVNVSTFSGNHTLRFQQRAWKGGPGHADWCIDDVRLMAGPALFQPVISRPEMTKPPAGPVVTDSPARPVITEPSSSFQPLQFLACLARKIHDEFFSFIPLGEGVSSADPGCGA